MDQQLIVAGFHRSGTSFTTQVLQEAGLFVGDELLGADTSNPYGHFEDLVPYRIHKAILADNGTDWRVAHARPFRVSEERWGQLRAFVGERRARHTLWGFKDPRVCFFLGVWKHLLPEARILVVFRDYRDAAWSLRRRHAANIMAGRGEPDVNETLVLDPDLAVNMWTAHNVALLAAIQMYRSDVLVVPLDAVQQGFPLIPRLNHRFDLELRRVEARHFYDPDVTVAEDRPLPVSSLDTIRRAERTLAALWKAADT